MKKNNKSITKTAQYEAVLKAFPDMKKRLSDQAPDQGWHKFLEEAIWVKALSIQKVIFEHKEMVASLENSAAGQSGRTDSN